MILITGVTGFVGRAVMKEVLANGYKLVAVVRDLSSVLCNSNKNVSWQEVGNIDSNTDWSEALKDIQIVIHCAARAHVLHEDTNDVLEAYREVNYLGTLRLAEQASAAGVRRFIFLSSIKVLGDFTPIGRPFKANDMPKPSDPYGISKFEAEQVLLEIESKSSMQVVIVRPPMVYGPGVKGNFASMIHWIILGIPLPLGSIRNLRSMVALDNLVDLLIVCLKHPKAAGQTFLVSDGCDISTPELLYKTAQAMGKKINLLPIPSPALEFVASLLGKKAVSKRLCSSLQVNIEKTHCLLDWTPPITLDQGLKKTVNGIKW
jgi:nucleoside-diphosphate-sugar epimerase